jgi:putative spermidine/putrescine transport system permease protein
VVVRIAGWLIVIALLLPIVVTVVVAFNPSGFVLPPSGFTLRWFAKAIGNRDFVRGFYVSLVVATVAAVLATALGLLAALGYVRGSFPGKGGLNLFLLSPLMVPVVVLGLALYTYFVALRLNDTLTALVIGHTISLIPLSFRTVAASLYNFDRSLEEAALNVGATRWQTFVGITLPIIKLGIVAGFILSFIMSWNNFSISLFLAGSRYVPLPVGIYSYIKFEFDAVAAAVSTILIVLSGVAIVLVDRTVGLNAVVGLRKG